VFDNLSLDISSGDFVCFLGPSGCGKTTMLRMIAGLDLDFDGEIRIGSKKITGPGRDRALVFQNATLLPWMTVSQNIGFALDSNLPELEKNTMIQCALRLVELDNVGSLKVSQLSGGMRKRVALAQAIADPPQTLLLDEPFVALDFYTREMIQENISRIQRCHQLTTLMVTHDLEEAVYLSDRIIVFSKSPVSIIGDFLVNIKRPRDRTEPTFLRHYTRLRALMNAARP
jgi:ABC-type nitrate/sulfonate/bicarbonate transport system ATPase subunit